MHYVALMSYAIHLSYMTIIANNSSDYLEDNRRGVRWGCKQRDYRLREGWTCLPYKHLPIAIFLSNPYNKCSILRNKWINTIGYYTILYYTIQYYILTISTWIACILFNIKINLPSNSIANSQVLRWKCCNSSGRITF